MENTAIDKTVKLNQSGKATGTLRTIMAVQSNGNIRYTFFFTDCKPEKNGTNCFGGIIKDKESLDNFWFKTNTFIEQMKKAQEFVIGADQTYLIEE